MKLAFVFFAFLFSMPDKDVLVYRDLLNRSVNSAPTAQFFFNKSKQIGSEQKPILRGYKAMASFIMCKHVYNPFTKLSYFNKGKTELDRAIAAEPENVELHFLRFATQCNTPSFLNYNNNISDDKLKLLAFLNKKNSIEDSDLKAKICTFMLQCKYCSVDEINMVKRLAIN